MVRKGTGLALTVLASAQAHKTLWTINTNNKGEESRGKLLDFYTQRKTILPKPNRYPCKHDLLFSYCCNLQCQTLEQSITENSGTVWPKLHSC